MENSDKALNTGAKRVYDVAPSEMFAEFMKTGWAATPLTGITHDEVISHCVHRRAALSAAFTGVRLVIPSGGPKQRNCVDSFTHFVGKMLTLELIVPSFNTF